MADEVDLSAYLSLPRCSARQLLALGRLLLRSIPADPSVALRRAAQTLEVEVDGFLAGLRGRRAGVHESTATTEEELDFATDGLWKVFAERLEQWRVFERRAFRRLAEAQAEARDQARAHGLDEGQFDYIGRVERAERAGYLRNYLFGGLGTEFTRMPYPVQVEFIATIWTVIDQEGLEEEYAGLVGHELLDALRDTHRRYLVMLKSRHDRGVESSFNLNARRARLQRRLMLYIAAAVVMADEDDEDSVARTRAALAPVDMLRELDERDAGSIAHEGDEEIETDRFEAELGAIDELLGADAQAVAGEVSETSGPLR